MFSVDKSLISNLPLARYPAMKPSMETDRGRRKSSQFSGKKIEMLIFWMTMGEGKDTDTGRVRVRDTGRVRVRVRGIEDLLEPVTPMRDTQV